MNQVSAWLDKARKKILGRAGWDNFEPIPASRQFFPCTGPHTHGAKHDPLFPAGALRISAARRRATATEASLWGDGSTLCSGPLNTEALAGSSLSSTQRRRAQRRTHVQRLRDGHAWQTVDEVRKVLMQFHRPLQQVLGKGFKTKTTRTSLLSTCASNTSSTDFITKHATHLAPAPLCFTDSDLDEAPVDSVVRGNTHLSEHVSGYPATVVAQQARVCHSRRVKPAACVVAAHDSQCGGGTFENDCALLSSSSKQVAHPRESWSGPTGSPSRAAPRASTREPRIWGAASTHGMEVRPRLEADGFTVDKEAISSLLGSADSSAKTWETKSLNDPCGKDDASATVNMRTQGLC